MKVWFVLPDGTLDEVDMLTVNRAIIARVARDELRAKYVIHSAARNFQVVTTRWLPEAPVVRTFPTLEAAHMWCVMSGAIK